MILILICGLILGAAAHSDFERAELGLTKKIDSALQELADLEEERRSLQAQIRSPALSNRHGFTDVNLFSAYSTGSQCGTGIIGNWIEYLDVVENNNANAFNQGTGIYTIPTVSTNTVFWYYFNACFLCAQNSACDIRLIVNGNAVAAIGNRDSNGSQRFNQMCNGKVVEVNAGNTVYLREEAGGGTPNNCKRSGAWIHNTFNGFMIRRHA